MPQPALEERVPLVTPDDRTLAEFGRWTRRMLKRCRQLRIGDEVRFVQMPSDAEWPEVRFAPETKRLYKRLIARRRPSRIAEFDEWRIPWIHYRFRGRNGRWEYHSLAVNDDSWVRVKKRTSRLLR